MRFVVVFQVTTRFLESILVVFSPQTASTKLTSCSRTSLSFFQLSHSHSKNSPATTENGAANEPTFQREGSQRDTRSLELWQSLVYVCSCGSHVSVCAPVAATCLRVLLWQPRVCMCSCGSHVSVCVLLWQPRAYVCFPRQMLPGQRLSLGASFCHVDAEWLCCSAVAPALVSLRLM